MSTPTNEYRAALILPSISFLSNTSPTVPFIVGVNIVGSYLNSIVVPVIGRFVSGSI